jgi:hypothetical protein
MIPNAGVPLLSNLHHFISALLLIPDDHNADPLALTRVWGVRTQLGSNCVNS